MPKYRPQADELDESTYGGGKSAATVGPPETGGDPSEKTSEPKESVDEENSESAEILVSKKDLPGAKEGDKCTFKVVHDYGDEFSLSYVKEEEPEGEPQTNDENMASVGSDFAAMAGKE